jgi:hypothetical protein
MPRKGSAPANALKVAPDPKARIKAEIRQNAQTLIARPTQWDEETIKRSIERNRGMLGLVAKELGYSYTELRKIIISSDVLNETSRLQWELFVNAAELKLYEAVLAGEAWAIQFTLRTLGKERYSERQEIQVTETQIYKIYHANEEFNPDDA